MGQRWIHNGSKMEPQYNRSKMESQAVGQRWSNNALKMESQWVKDGLTVSQRWSYSGSKMVWDGQWLLCGMDSGYGVGWTVAMVWDGLWLWCTIPPYQHTNPPYPTMVTSAPPSVFPLVLPKCWWWFVTGALQAPRSKWCY